MKHLEELIDETPELNSIVRAKYPTDKIKWMASAYSIRHGQIRGIVSGEALTPIDAVLQLKERMEKNK